MLQKMLMWVLVVGGVAGCASPHSIEASSGPTEEIVQKIKRGDISYRLAGRSIDPMTEVLDRSLVCDWVTQGKREAVQALVDATPAINKESLVVRLPLLACAPNKQDYTHYKQLGASVKRYSSGYLMIPGFWPHATPLSEAAGNGNALAVSLLIADGAPVDEPGHRKTTPLGYALLIKEQLASGPPTFRPGPWNAGRYDAFGMGAASVMQLGPNTLADLDRVVNVLLQSGASADELTADAHPIGTADAKRPGETLRQRFGQDPAFQKALALARELRKSRIDCLHNQALTACREIVARADPLSPWVAEADQVAAGLVQDQATWARLVAEQRCRLQREDWVYQGAACANGLAHGVGQAKSRDGKRSFSGRFERGQPVQGKLLYMGQPNFEGDFKNLLPNGQGMCWHGGQPEACQMVDGQRVDALHKQREEHARQMSEWQKREEEAEEARIRVAHDDARRRRDREAEERRERRSERALAAGAAAMRGGASSGAAVSDSLASSLRMQQQQAQIMAQGMSDLKRIQEQREAARREQARDAAWQGAAPQSTSKPRQAVPAAPTPQPAPARDDDRQRQERQAQRQAEEAEQSRLAADYLRAIKEGSRLKAVSCYGKQYVTGTRPRVKEPAHMSSCVDLHVTAWCPGDRAGRPVVASNFVGMSGCMGDIYRIDPQPACEAEQIDVRIEEAKACR